MLCRLPWKEEGTASEGATLEPLYQFHFFKKRVLSTSNLLGDVLGAGDAAGSRPGAWLAEIYLSAESANESADILPDAGSWDRGGAEERSFWMGGWTRTALLEVMLG